MERFDVAVAGAGPAGSSAALVLARAGARVALLDRASFPRYKTCGGGVVLRARRLMRPDIASVVERACASASFHLVDSGLRFDARGLNHAALVSLTMRDRLDQLLAEGARDAGADLMASRAVTGLERRHGNVLLATTQGPLTADFVIGADGALSEVARLAGWRSTAHLAPALECEVPAGPDVLARFPNPLFHVGTIASGYAWVFPKAARLSVGVMTSLTPAHDLRRDLEHYLKSQGLGGTPGMERHGFVIPVRPRAEPAARDRVFLVGDAAGFADPVAAEGISHAVQSGALAATAIADAAGDPERARLSYLELLREDLLVELLLARGIARVLYSPRLRSALFRRFGEALVAGFTRVFAGEQTYRGALEAPLVRLLGALG